MRITELLLAAGVMLGILFKLLYWMGGNMLIVFCGCALALYYFPFGYRTLPSPTRRDQIPWLSLSTGAALFAALVGLVGHMHFWPGSHILLVGGAIACALMLPAAALMRPRHRNLDVYLDGLMLRCLAMGALALATLVLFAPPPTGG